jgi:hypothetical protein
MYKKLREELRFYDPFYGDPNEKYIFPYELVIKGYYCVVRNPQDNYNWHRAIIIDDREGFDDETNEAIHSVTVFAIDWGNTIIERRDELRLIKKQFFKYPPFAVRVSLAGIAPICQDWTPEATVFMKAFISRFCAEYTMACAFLYPLDSDYYSVLLGHLVEVTKEGIREKMMIYLHEKMIRRNLARIKVTEDDDFNFSPVSRITYLPMPSVSHIEDEDYVSTRNEITLYEALNENLLQIKLEPFDEQVIKQESVDCEEKQIDSNCDKKDSINGKESVEEAVIDYKSKYFTSSNGIRKREYYHKEMTVEPKPKYFPLEKWTECKPKYYPLQESVERKPKYGDLLWKIEGRKYYQKQDLNLVINKPKYFTQELLNEFRKKYSSVH